MSSRSIANWRYKWLLRTVMMVLCCALTHSIPAEADMVGQSSELKLSWEYPAGRNPTTYLLVRLDRVEKEGGGLFGVRRSPSLAGAMDDATIWDGTVTQGAPAGTSIHIRVPGEDVPNVGKGDRVSLGLVEGTICICARVPPANLNDADAQAWIAAQGCASKP